METTTQETTISKAVEECHDMFYKVRSFYKNVKPSDITNKMCEELHKRIIEEHKDFSKVYPMIIRVMVYDRFFNENVVRKYFKYVSNHVWKNREEFLEVQGEYMVYVERFRHPRKSQKDIWKYRDYIVDTLKKEDKEFETITKSVTKEMEKEIEKGKELTKQKLIEALEKLVNKQPECSL